MGGGGGVIDDVTLARTCILLRAIEMEVRVHGPSRGLGYPAITISTIINNIIFFVVTIVLIIFFLVIIMVMRTMLVPVVGSIVTIRKAPNL